MKREGWGGVGIAFMLAGCATTAPEPKIVTKEVLVPVARSCVPSSLPGPLSYADTRSALRAAQPEERYHLMVSEWARRDTRLALVEGVLAACR